MCKRQSISKDFDFKDFDVFLFDNHDQEGKPRKDLCKSITLHGDGTTIHCVERFRVRCSLLDEGVQYFTDINDAVQVYNSL